jgi:hypothetical protein
LSYLGAPDPASCYRKHLPHVTRDHPSRSRTVGSSASLPIRIEMPNPTKHVGSTASCGKMTMIIRGPSSTLLHDDEVIDSLTLDWRWCGVARFESGHNAYYATPDEERGQ